MREQLSSHVSVLTEEEKALVRRAYFILDPAGAPGRLDWDLIGKIVDLVRIGIDEEQQIIDLAPHIH